MEPRIVTVWCTACLLWSSTYLFIRLGLTDVSPLTFAWVRLAIAASVLAPITIARRGFVGLTQRDVAHIMCAGVLLLGLNYGLVYWGAQFIPSGLVAILQSATPVLALALGWLLGSETVTMRKIVALAAGALGVALIFRSEAHASGMAALRGSLAVIGSSACIAFAYVWLKGYGRRLPPLTVTTLQCIAGAVPLAAIGLALEGSPAKAAWSATALAAVLYLALCGSVLAFWLNYWLLERMEASAMLMMGVAEVPIAVALGAAIFEERLPPGTLMGALCVLAGVILGPITTPAETECRGSRFT
jgi:drug/metabolite transporter (DMT)-like permease